MRKLSTSVLGLILLLSTMRANAVVVVINTGTAGSPTSSVGPIMLTASGFFKASRYSYLYTQAELAAAGITSGSVITSLGWMKSNAAPTNGGPAHYRIYMKNSSATAYANATETWANLNAGATMVYENLTQVIPATMSPNYIDFTLNASFTYTGGSLEIGTEWDASAVTGNPGTNELLWMWSTVPDRIYGTCQTNLTTLGALSSTTSNTAINDRRPFIQITYTPATTSAPTCVTTPTAPANAGNACAGATTLSWPAVPGATGYDVYLDAGSNATTLVSTNQPGTTYAATITTGIYAWRIVPQNSNGSATGCATFTFTGDAPITPSVSISSNPTGAICAGVPVIFSATPVNGGASPTYQWKKNNVNVGTNSATYTDNALVTGDAIIVQMTSNAACASTTPVSSTPIVMSVGTSVAPTVNISAVPAGAICTGTSVTFTATATNGGSAPFYQWKVNGINSGTNSSTFTTTTLGSGDVVTVQLTSNATCAVPPTATSAGIATTVNPAVAPLVSVGASPGTTIVAGQMVTFTATALNGGPTPVYQWRRNGNPVGTNAPTYATNTLVNNDVVTVQLTSNAPCANPASATSTPLTMTITTGVADVTGLLSGITIFPNPSSGTITVEGTVGQTIPGERVKLEMQSLLGQVIYSEDIAVAKPTFEQKIALPNTAAGVYMIQLQYGDRNVTHRLTIAR